MLTGSCLCGGVAYEADAPLERIVHCHCQTCRKTHGTAFSSVTAVSREKFRWVRGQDLLGAFESSPGKFRRFCTKCGSHIMAERNRPAHCAAAAGLPRHQGRGPAAGPYLAIGRGLLVRPEAVVA